MCGRYAQSLNTSELAEEFGVGVQTHVEELPSTWNIAPTNPIYIVRASQMIAEQRELSIASWGIMAHWHQSESEARASQSHAINARSESIHEKPTFRNAFRTQRCLVPADGYYEWATSLGKYPPKQPFYICSQDEGKSLSIAGIWSTWKNEKGEDIQSAIVFTRTKHRANRLSEFLTEQGFSCDTFHSNKRQAQRTKALKDFKSGS